MEEHNDILDDMDRVGPKERHGCVSAWLIFMIIGNALAALVYFFFWDTIMEQMPEEALDQMPDVNATILGALVVVNLIFAILLLKWKKIGFWGSLATTVLSFALNISGGMEPNQAASGVIGIILLYGILQIPYNGISAWKHME